MRGVLRFIVAAALIIACLIVFVVVSFRLNWSWVGNIPGSSAFRPSALMLGDWIMGHLLIVLVVFLVALVFVWITGRRYSIRAGKAHRHDYGAEIAKRFGHARSPEWPRVEREHRLREPACVACGYRGRHLQVHHIKPFHLHPHLELDPNNLITLCQAKDREHHLLLGHLDEWGSYNENVRHDAKHYYRKSAAHIRSDHNWQKRVLQRP